MVSKLWFGVGFKFHSPCTRIMPDHKLSAGAGQALPKYINYEKKKSVEALVHDDQIHKRLLRANTNDYGSYDPAPTFHKPKFKQIPN